MNKTKESKRNKIAQHIRMIDGTIKTIFHDKKFGRGSYKEIWQMKNKAPKPNSKRQKLLREQTLTV